MTKPPKLVVMSYLLETYRSNAAAARLEAESTNLPKVRQRSIEAAVVWERLAERLASAQSRQRERDALIVSRLAGDANT
jgi:hypothetical protein